MTLRGYRLLLTSLGVAGCTDAIAPPALEGPPMGVFEAAQDHEPGPVCTKDPRLLALVGASNTSCCGAVSPSQLADCVVTSCSEHPEAHCDPGAGYQCSGRISLAPHACASPPSNLCCPSDFARPEAGGDCEGNWPITCDTDAICPDGMYCDQTRGGICWLDCIADSEGCTCRCDGRCAETFEEAMPTDRGTVRLKPDSVEFAPTDLDQFRRVRLSYARGRDEDAVLRLIAPRNWVVACSVPTGGPELHPQAWTQECDITFAANDGPLTEFWVAPRNRMESNDPAPEVTEPSDGVVIRRVGDPGLRMATLFIAVAEEPPTAPAPSGWYIGTMALAAIGGAEGSDPTESVALGEAPAYALELPVRGWVEALGGSTRLVLEDPTRVISDDGWLEVAIPAGIGSAGAPSGGRRAWIDGEPLTVAKGDVATPYITVAVSSDVDHELVEEIDSATIFTSWTAAEETLRVIIPMTSGDLGGAAPGWTFVATLAPDRDRRGVAPTTLPAPAPGTPSFSPSFDRMYAAVGPYVDDWYLMRYNDLPITPQQSIASCLAGGAIGAPPLVRVCMEGFGQTQAACEYLLGRLQLANPTANSVNELYLPCQTNPALPDQPWLMCKCNTTNGRLDSTTLTSSGWTGQTIAACPNDPKLPEVPADDRLYWQAASCASRISAWSPSAGKAHWYDATAMILDGRVPLAPGGDLLWQDLFVTTASALWVRALPQGVQPPLSLPLYTVDNPARSARQTAETCIADLTEVYPQAAGEDYDAIFAGFAASECVSPLRAQLELAWLGEAAYYEGLLGPENATTRDRRTAGKLLHSRMRDWLDIHALIARHVAQSARAEPLISDLISGEPTTTEQLDVTAEEALDIVVRGYGPLLWNGVYRAISTSPESQLLAPDYRAGIASDDLDLSGRHSIPLPVVLLEVLESTLGLLDVALDDLRVDAYAECSEGDDTPTLDHAADLYGDTVRLALTVEALADTMYDRLTVAPAWEDRWDTARGLYAAALGKVQRKLHDILGCANPLGIADDTIPLYFVDPSGVNQRFFASSDYLVQQWAIPAVGEAHATLEAARSAYLQKRDSELRQQVLENERERTIATIKQSYGGKIQAACGFDVPAERVFDAFMLDDKAAGLQTDLTTCYEVPTEVNPACGGLVDQVWESVRSQVADELMEVCPDVEDDFGIGVHNAKRKLCMMAREAAEFEANARAKGNAFAYWVRADELHKRTLGQSRERRLHNGELDEFPESNFEFIEGLFGDDFPALRAKMPPTTWPNLDELITPELFCGRYLQVPDGPMIALADIEERFDAMVASSGYKTDVVNGCSSNECKPYGSSMAWMTGKHAVWCDDYLFDHLLTSDLITEEDIPDVGLPIDETAACLRGDLAVHDVNILKALDTIRMAQANMDRLMADYDSAARKCIMLAQIGDTQLNAMAQHYRTMKRLREKRTWWSFVLNSVGAVAQGVAGVLLLSNPVTTVFGAGLIASGVSSGIAIAGGELDQNYAKNNNEKMQKVQHEHEQTLVRLQGQATAVQCWTEVSAIASSIRFQSESVTGAILSAVEARLLRSNAIRDLQNTIAEGKSRFELEQSLDNVDFRHHYWLDERTERFDREFAWAKHLTYLAMMAVEYELQAELGLRGLILGARHPDELDIALQRIQQEQATRGINGNRPEEKTIVLSLRDEVLDMVDREILMDPLLAASRQITKVGELRELLFDPSRAVYDGSGRYLGQGIPFHLKPRGPLAYRCGERMWGVGATIVGDLIGGRTPSVPVFLLKRNTFASQWCEGHGPDDEALQIASLKPSMNLFKDGQGQGDPGEAEAYSWAYIDAWINVKRKDFSSDQYAEGDSEELAGRGLYGDYILLFPQQGLLDAALDLRRIEDVLLRFDYISVSDGGSLGDGDQLLPPEPPLMDVDDFNVTAGKCDVEMTWSTPDFPGFNGVSIVRKVGAPSVDVDDGELLPCDAFGNDCTVPIRTPALHAAGIYYTAFVEDDMGYLVDAKSVAVDAPDFTLTNLQAASVIGGVSLTWNRPSPESCTTWKLYRSTNSAVTTSDTLVAQSTGTSRVDQVYSTATYAQGKVAGWWYGLFACYGPDHATNCVPTASPVTTGIAGYRESFETTAAFSLSGTTTLLSGGAHGSYARMWQGSAAATHTATSPLITTSALSPPSGPMAIGLVSVSTRVDHAMAITVCILGSTDNTNYTPIAANNCTTITPTAWTDFQVRLDSPQNLPRYVRVSITRPATGGTALVAIDNIQIFGVLQ